MLNEEGIRLKTGGFIPSEFELERDVQEELLSWKVKRHNTVLQIEGPRQVGKTHEVRKFAYSQYEQVIYVNLVRDEFGFEDCMAEEHFMQEYCEHAGLGDYVDNSNTILIIDEIQERQTVYNAIRDLREKLSCDIIVSGSYLARTVHSKDFFLPAGIAYIRMLPLSFREFCRALKLEYLLSSLHPYGKSPAEDYEKLEVAYRVFRKIGGYPEVVTTYLKTGSEDECMDVLENLVETFTAESSRFFSNSTALSVFQEVYRAVLVQMAEEKKGTGKNLLEDITEFVKDSVKEPVSRNEVRGAASWLLYSGIIGYCDLYNNGDVTDVINNRRSYFLDTGIANYVSSMVVLPKGAVEGLLTETFAYTELNRLYQKAASKKKVLGNKPCFSTCGSYELDFVVVDKNYIRYGIEVKSSNNQAKSLKFYKEKGFIDRAIRAIPSKGGCGDAYDTIPIYLIGEIVNIDRRI